MGICSVLWVYRAGERGPTFRGYLCLMSEGGFVCVFQMTDCLIIRIFQRGCCSVCSAAIVSTWKPIDKHFLVYVVN